MARVDEGEETADATEPGGKSHSCEPEARGVAIRRISAEGSYRIPVGSSKSSSHALASLSNADAVEWRIQVECAVLGGWRRFRFQRSLLHPSVGHTYVPPS